MFKIEYDLESLETDLENLEKKDKLNDWYYTIVETKESKEIELNLDDEKYGSEGFFEVKQNNGYLEFRFFFYEDDSEEDKGDNHDSEVYSYFYSKLVKFVLAEIIKSGEKISIIKG
ncbi:MAG: hypothetical protein FWE18_04245 [Alphaproteobacteria bacterium]|nr:hypothetical protein [Alphaproteobacteria bacterium]